MSWRFLGILCTLVVVACGGGGDPENAGASYFLAIHNEPRPEHFYSHYEALELLVDKANEYNMKLTLMFTPQWVDYILLDEARREKLEQWKNQGHEISGHHHSAGHPGVWDGYTYKTEQEALAIRAIIHPNNIEEYLGDLDDYTSELRRLNSQIQSGCMNDALDKNALPSAIVFDTCSGYQNHGEPGTRMGDEDASKGINEFISKATILGVERKWLAHTALIEAGSEEGAKEAFTSMKSGVYGAVTHSIRFEDPVTGMINDQAGVMIEFMDFLHQNDPEGQRSMTVTEIMESGILPEIEISVPLVGS